MPKHGHRHYAKAEVKRVEASSGSSGLPAPKVMQSHHRISCNKHRCGPHRVYEVGEDSGPNRNCSQRSCVPGEAIGEGNVLSIC